MIHKLPVMQCDPDCGECCGPAFCNESEFKAVMAFAKKKGIEPLQQGITCPFFQGGTCSVYEVRPFVCRLFGHTPKLTCCRGYNRNLPPAQERRLMNEYKRKGNPMAHCLHQACYTGDEILELLDRYHESLLGKEIGDGC